MLKNKPIDIDFVDKCPHNFNIQDAIKNQKIEDKLNVICVMSNPCNYKRRVELAKIFINHMLQTKDVVLYVVECIYPHLNQTYQITEENTPNHLQLTATSILWTKENMINVAVKKLLPADYKAFAFIDADLHFNNENWAQETLRALNSCDILQPFTDGYNLNQNNKIDRNSKMLYSICYLWQNYRKPKKTTNLDIYYLKDRSELWHPGWAWAMTRTAYEKMNGIYDMAIIGGGDSILAKSIMLKDYMNTKTPYIRCSLAFRKSLYDYQQKCLGLKVGYVQGTLFHFYHGSLQNRQYTSRWDLLNLYQYNPYLHLKINECGMYQGSQLFPKQLQNCIIQYFNDRNEDN
jgi:hypothetical protein